MDQYKEGQDNPFDAPVPGQGLTDDPGNYPWEHPPQYTDTSEAADFVWDRLHRPEFAEHNRRASNENDCNYGYESWC